MDTTEEKLIRLEEKYDKLAEENKNLKEEVSSLKNKLGDVNETLARIDEGNKNILEKINTLNDNWKNFDNMQKKNANSVKMQIITTTIGVIIGAVVSSILTIMRSK
ncbi:hypothetical protein [Clostridium cellulovorans]|uniref:Uncharacterized protein n=1 Tax=Clostridium cellulovorans (strain ATCC 35296 / DSM 3052 / OCM 3 / 743B) TaxID=573061 RepID=D9SVZ0_CLOC7|nr:hypothetical protein [Clostridium cellulovorans]ADL53201.1 hypothetical protein Clocel_3525 [Clostridium cellulovorans 743B]